jgi:tyrosyl-tRNA synthetase
MSLEEIRDKEKKLKEGVNPMEVKLFLAAALTRRYHGEKVARQEKGRLLKTFSQKKTPEKMPVIKFAYGLYDPIEFLLKTDLVPSKPEARRLIGQGAVDIDGRTLASPAEKVEIKKGVIIKIGKRNFVRVQ